MEAAKKRHIKTGDEYNMLFPKAEGNDKTIRKNANVYHTVDFIPKVVHETLDHTEAIARKLKGNSHYQTCANIWHFVYKHINYKKDREGYEQIRSPARTWKDRFSGVDCDCYSTFISSILTNLGVPHLLRITKYHRDYFQHIYPVVKNGGREIIIDCVTDKFDYEVPYSEKKDYPMDLQYLNGLDGDGMEDLGKIIKRNMAKKNQEPVKAGKKGLPLFSKLKAKKAAKSNQVVPGASTVTPAGNKKKKGFLKKVVSKINKVNPATILLRNGVLASMKLNIKNVAGRLRWSYLTPEQAAARGIIAEKFQKLVATRQKLENIFTTAGGKLENLKKAILGGKGNKDKAVSGLGMLPVTDWTGYMNENTPLADLLGRETYFSENSERIEGLGQLGEPVTLTTIAAAAGVLAGIVGALKQIGDIFGGKGKGSEDFEESKTEAPENNLPASASNSSAQLPSAIVSLPENSGSQNFNQEEIQDYASSTSLIKTNESGSYASEAEQDNESRITEYSNASGENNAPGVPAGDKENFWEKNKNWLKPVAIGAGGLTLIALGFQLIKGGKTHNKSSPSRSLSGLPKKKKTKRKKRRSGKTKRSQKKAIALL